MSIDLFVITNAKAFKIDEEIESNQSKASKLSVLALQESATTLKSKNDLFGFAKKSQKIIEKIIYIISLKEDNYKSQIRTVANESTYKNINILENFLQDGGKSSKNIKKRIFELLEEDDIEQLKEFISLQKTIAHNIVEKIKKEIMSATNTMTRRTVADINNIGQDISNGFLEARLKQLKT